MTDTNSWIMYSGLFSPWLVIVTFLSIAVGVLSIFFHTAYSLPEKAPTFIQGWPIVGCLRFFTARWDFHKSAAASSPTGNFSYYVGTKPVVGLSGDQSRKFFFENRRLNFGAGYEGLFAGSPPSKSNDESSEQGGAAAHFVKRLILLLKRENFDKGLPYLIQDTRDKLDELSKDSTGLTDPFDSIYRIIFQLTMRTVACKELAEDQDALQRVLHQYEMVEASATPAVVMYPSMPSISRLKRLWGGGKIYMTFDKIIQDRKRTGRREDDPLQTLLDLGDNTVQIITFVMGALFAGQLNSGINAAWIIVYLASHAKWRAACQRELESVAARYSPDHALPLIEQLAVVPLEAWESAFPVADACLRDSIRLQTNGVALRQNTTTGPIALNDHEVVPSGFFVTYPLAEVHGDPLLYPDPDKWDPARYVNENGTPVEHPQGENKPDEPRNYTFLGWGAARHPCLGMRFAKLEQNIIVAFWLAYFDFELERPTGDLPVSDKNAPSAQKPKEQVRIRYWAKGTPRPTTTRVA